MIESHWRRQAASCWKGSEGLRGPSWSSYDPLARPRPLANQLLRSSVTRSCLLVIFRIVVPSGDSWLSLLAPRQGVLTGVSARNGGRLSRGHWPDLSSVESVVPPPHGRAVLRQLSAQSWGFSAPGMTERQTGLHGCFLTCPVCGDLSC